MPNLGLARLRVAERFGRSVVVDQYSQAPLQLHRPLYRGGSPNPVVYLKTPSAGLLDGDEHRLEVAVGEGCFLELRTQAATLVYPGSSKQEFDIDVASGATLVFLPHQLIMAKGARLSQNVSIHLRSTSRLLYSEGWSAGRLAMGECWQFESLANKLQIFVDDKITFRENWNLIPQTMAPGHPLLCGEYVRFSNYYEFGLDSRPSASAIDNVDSTTNAACGKDDGASVEWELANQHGRIQRSAFKS